MNLNVTDEEVALIKELNEKGLLLDEIVKKVNRSKSTIRAAIAGKYDKVEISNKFFDVDEYAKSTNVL